MPDLAKLVNELNALADSINQEARNKEDHYEAIHLGITATVQVNKDIYLSYGKHNGTWRLLVTNNGLTKPFGECSREVRFSVHPYFKVLDDEIAKILRTKITLIKGVRQHGR